MVWLPSDEKKIEDIFLRFERMFERDGRIYIDCTLIYTGWMCRRE